MRPTLTFVHRWAGLVTAGFLFLSGLTGAVISWDHELDEWLNPHLTEARSAGPARDMLALAAELEARHPQVQVSFVPLAAEPGHSVSFFVEPRLDPASGSFHEPGFNQVFVDPASGQELGRREWGAVWPVTRENLISFLYKLHYSLHLPEIAGTDQWGVWLLGVIALVWTLDCFVGFVLTLPARARAGAPARSWWRRWLPAWRVRTGAGTYKLNFDLHRAFSLWTWALLFIVAFTAFSLNLYREVFFPAMSLVSDVTPSPFDVREPAPLLKPHTPQLGFAQALARARQEAARRGWAEPAGSLFYSREFDVFGVAFFRPEDGHGAGGVGHRTLYLDGQDARLLGAREPWQGTAADIFVQAQFPLHSGRILGLPGRILISAMGVVVALLSATGVYIWWKKRRARLAASAAEARPGSAGRVPAGRQPSPAGDAA